MSIARATCVAWLSFSICATWRQKTYIAETFTPAEVVRGRFAKAKCPR